MTAGKRECRICGREDRAEIDAGLLLGRPLRAIASEFGVSRSSLHRHSRHVSGAVARAASRVSAAYTRDLRAWIRQAQEMVLGIMKEAKLRGDAQTALAAGREVRENAKVMARLILKTPDGKVKPKHAGGPTLGEYLERRGAHV
jgi:transposase-like protein